MNVSAQLRYQTQPQAAAVAWLIPGASAEVWLTELIAWHLPLNDLRLYVAPQNNNEPACGGVLVIPPHAVQPSTTSRACGYRLVAGRLYLPVDGRVEPPVGDREWDDLLPGDDEIYLWHPTLGLICFPRQIGLRVADLLAAPPPRAGNWNRAQPGTAVNARLHSIEPDSPIDPTSFLEEGRDDIGTQPPKLKFLPATEQERRQSPLAGPASAGLAMMAQAISWLTSHAPHTASQRTWINDLEDWAGRTLGQYRDWLHQRRHKELARLLDLLKHQPDEGLKYALPLGMGDHRGLAPPGENLMRRDVNFDLRRLGGGGPADFWDVPPDYRFQLMTRYRELANREIALGRHRRAAYIFAELLGELHSAAATLADGGHFREAAALYQDRLNQPQDAARCLRQGGYWQQAIELYEQLGMFETVGDLYRQLEDAERADQAYRRAVEALMKGMDYLQAAALLEQKLQQPGEASECLLQGWPYSGQAQQCLAELFKLLARRGLHEQALGQVNHLPTTVITRERVPMLADVLADVAVSYPDEHVQWTAADQTRVLAASRLAQATPAEARALTNAVRRLVPKDRLLARDCQRFVSLREAAVPKPAPVPVSRAGLKLVKEIKLEAYDWRVFVASGDVFYAAGYRDDELVLLRGLPDGTLHQPHKKPWRVDRAVAGKPILLACDPQPGAGRVFVHVPLAPSLTYDRPFPPHGDFHDPVVAGPLAGSGRRALAIQASRQLLRFAQWADIESLAVVTHSSSGELLGNYNFETEFVVIGDSPSATLFFHENLICLGVGKTLAVWDGQRESQVEMPHAIHALAGSLPHTRHRTVAGLEQGAMFFAGDPSRVKAVPLAENLHRPAVGLTRRGHLIAASTAEIQVYDTQGGRLKFLTQVVGCGADPIAILAPMKTNQFIVAHADGRLLVYQVT